MEFNEICIGLPVFNESKNILGTLEKTLDYVEKYKNWQIIIVDNNSTDNSVEVINNFLKNKIIQINNKIKFIKNEKNLFYSGSSEIILQNSIFNTVGIVDSDGQYDLNDFDKLLSKINQGSDFVVGYRKKRNDNFFRIFMSAIFQYVTFFLIKNSLRDLNSGIKIIKKNKKIETYCNYLINFSNPELFCKYKSLDLTISETQVNHYERSQGESLHKNFLNVNKVISFFKYLFYCRSLLI
mgnify:CR=1 FL=1